MKLKFKENLFVHIVENGSVTVDLINNKVLCINIWTKDKCRYHIHVDRKGDVYSDDHVTRKRYPIKDFQSVEK